MSSQNKKEHPKTDEQDRRFIVGIGASAGGLEALQKFLSALAPDTGFPYIIVQHLSPDYKSLLGEILGKYTEMPVIQVEDGMEVVPNTVYVIQPGKNMRIKDGKLWLTPQNTKGLNLPIDMFFRSLAADAGPQAIAIVLSGTGSDGSNGIKDVKEHDGMIIAQQAESAKFDGMPRSAIRTGLVDAQLTPEEMALEMRHIARAADKISPLMLSDEEIDERVMKKIYVILKKVSDVNFVHYKQSTIMRRIERRMMLVHKDTLADYLEYLYEAPEEAKTLSREVLIGVTNFFRDPEFFQVLQSKAVANIVRNSSPEEGIRIWVAGCSTGEEAYSIAILFRETMEALGMERPVKIFATDLDKEAILIAGKGVYGDNIIDSVSPARLSRYFTRKDNTYTVVHDVRKMVVFSPHNVIQDPPFGRLDLISCRNMLIYFQPILQSDLFAIFHTALKDGAYLFLGKSEAIGEFTDAFPVVDAVAKLFTHRADVKIPGAKSVPFLSNTYIDDDYADVRDIRFSRYGNAPKQDRSESDMLDTAVLEQFMPTCLVVNPKNEVTRIYGDSANYIHLPTGKFTNNLFEVISDALKVPVSTILKESRDKRAMAQYKDIAYHGERSDAVITMTAMPVKKGIIPSDELYAIVFTEATGRGEISEAVTYDIDRIASQRISDLEQELGEVQSKLSNSVAEQECVSEELQSANEELLTANEELQSSNEELQSVNEELYTVNSEFQIKVTELASLNNDIANFLSSTLTGIIFVDNDLCVRRFTEYASREFSIMEQDIGRPLNFLAYHFPSVELTELCRNVLSTLTPDEREVVSSKEKVFFIRIAPYRSTENKILGCVITLIDVTSQKRDQVQLAAAEQRLTEARETMSENRDYIAGVVDTMRSPIEDVKLIARRMRAQAEKRSADTSELDALDEKLRAIEGVVSDISELPVSEEPEKN